MICSILTESFSCIVGLNTSRFRIQRSYTFEFEIIQWQVDLAHHLFI